MAEYEENFKDPVKMKEFLNEAPPSELAASLGQFWMYSRDLVRNLVALTYNYTLGLGGIIGSPIDYKWSEIPVNGPQVTKLLYDVHGHQVFFDGIFNADPHAGNVMICRDGRLALIDYGNAPVLSHDYRIKVAKFIIALDSGSDDEIVQAYKNCGASTKKNSKRFLL